jgi:transposase-like protein
MARGQRDSGKEQFWSGIVRLWQRSGQTVRAFCDEQGVSEPSFYAWRRILAQRDRHAAAPAFVPLHITPAPATAPPPSLEVVVGAGRVVRVPPGFDAATLRDLLAVLEAPSC